jgi:hypothetical protein
MDPPMVRVWLPPLALTLAACGYLMGAGPGAGPPIAQGPVTAVPDLGGEEPCGPFAPATLGRCVEEQRLATDIAFVAAARPPGSEHHAAVREKCAERLAALGYEVERQGYDTGINVLGTRPGFSRAREQMVLGAHYDGVPGCADADDNASGVAVLLEAARVLGSARFDRTLVLACWDEGERGHRGSLAHARRAAAGSGRVLAALSLESVGHRSAVAGSQHVPEDFEQMFPDSVLRLIENGFRGDFLLVVGEDATAAATRALGRQGQTFALGIEGLTLTERLKREPGPMHRRDQARFWEQGIPALLLTDTGGFRNPRHHCLHSPDEPGAVDLDFVTRVTMVTVGALGELLLLR